ncbi:MAG: radical SAM protein [Lachnospiraceae bacterium]|nr:radical SAM protein [Lachnospiraceae bacterium]
MPLDKDWRKKEASLQEVQEKYPDVPKSFVLKADLQRRGIVFSKEALTQVDPGRHLLNSDGANRFRQSTDPVPNGLIMRDGSYLVIGNFDYSKDSPERDPYLIDFEDGKLVVKDRDEVIDNIQGFWEKPAFFNLLNEEGEPLSKYVACRPQRLEITLNNYCHFWDKPGEGCKYCPMSPNFKKSGRTEEHNELKKTAAAFREAVKQTGRNTIVVLTGGSILSGAEPFDDEVALYEEMLKLIGECFSEKRFPSQLISTAFSRKQLERLYENTGLMQYTPDLEVLDKEKFEWICPGKAAHVGYEEWKKRMYDAVEIFGNGNVTSGIVLGVEQAQPNGFKTEDEAFSAVTQQAEEIISHGIALAANIWRATPGSIFQNQKTPSLEYYVRTLREFSRLQEKYISNPYTDDYRRCGAHVGLDLMRTYQTKKEEEAWLS